MSSGWRVWALAADKLRLLVRVVDRLRPLVSKRETGSGGADTAAPSLSDEAGLYVHWPYCLRRCTYCNFNKYVWRGGSEDLRGSEEDMRGCLQREAETLLQLSQVSRITSVFFGGGTPSLASPATIAAVLETLAKHAHLPGNVEVTLEVNPTPVGVARLSEFHRAGVNRFSIGVQCLNDADLQLLGRDHSSQHALQALAEARRLCPGRVSVDVIFGRPGQSVLSWESELGRLLALCDDHVSLYQLTLERGTALFSQVRRGELSVTGEDDTARMYEVARGLLGHAGFRQYEVSNFARNGAISVHNQGYWRARQYIGVGPGAHSRFSPRGAGGQRREARTQTLEPEVWMREVRRCGHGTRRRLELDTLELLEEVLVMGLRMTEGIPHERWLQFCPWGSLGEVMEGSSEVRELLERGLLILDRRGLRCSWEGLAVLDSLLPVLLHQLHGHSAMASEPRRCSLDGPDVPPV